MESLNQINQNQTIRIRICEGANCQNFLSEDLFKHAQKIAKDFPNISVEKRGCMSRCTTSPNMQIINESTGESEIVTGISYKIIEEKIKNLTLN